MPIPFKICCNLSPEEADIAIAAGALAVGLVADMPNGPGVISDALVREIASHVHKKHGMDVWTTLLTSRTDGTAIADHIGETSVNTVQIVDAPTPGAYAIIRDRHPEIRIIQVIHVEDDSAIDQAVTVDAEVDFILLDSGKPSAQQPTLGGTGDTHDWSVSKRIVDSVKTPVFLAGGLSPDNVRDAVEAVRPYGVDICSGLRDRENGYRLVAEKVAAFASMLGEV